MTENLTKTASRSSLETLPKRLKTELGQALSESVRVTTSEFDRIVAAVDASHYLLTPKAVVTPRDVNDVAKVFRVAKSLGETVTFRSGGTSLAGQALTSSILVDTRKMFRQIWPSSDGTTVRVQPGATVRQVNTRLARFGKKLGPDPASEIACTIGGVVANNSSGMACGVAQNTYHTLKSAIIVLASGTVIDTSQENADEVLANLEPELTNSLLKLRKLITSDQKLEAEVARQYAIKNTMGYSLNSLLDYSRPSQILAHLMVGSEGTLGFVAEATFNTVDLKPHASTALLIFEDLKTATDSLVELISTSPATIELLDAASLRAAMLDEESRETLPKFQIENHCALLVEYQAVTSDELEKMCETASKLLARLALVETPRLSSDQKTRAALWHIRKGLYATVAGARPTGTTALLEDIAVPVARLSSTCESLVSLFAKHGYHDAVIFGHAKDGNIHFLINEDFETESGLERYRLFTEEMIELVLAAGGSLKAEHGTGRIMAPFVERQYGQTLYQVMLEIKNAFDPEALLNPDTLLTRDSQLHLKNLKSTPTVESEVDRCVECGYCEPVCPSKDLTVTPRQRIALRRAIKDASEVGNFKLEKLLSKAETYNAVETCAVDGMCQTACPVKINTGDLVRKRRADSVGVANSLIWNLAGKSWRQTTSIASLALSAASKFPSSLISIPNTVARSIVSKDVLPLWSADLPAGGKQRKSSGREAEASAVYFQACVGTMFGPTEGSSGVSVALDSLAKKAEVILIKPEGVADLCCGTPWKSKGITEGYEEMVEKTTKALWKATDNGRLPVVCDNSSCSEGLVLSIEKSIEANTEYRGMRIIDSVDFVAEVIVEKLQVESKIADIVIHPTCSSTRAGSNANLYKLAQAVSNTVTVPDNWGCCAFAGDRGMLHPELTESATSLESFEVLTREYDAYVSCNRTCEIGMSRATGKNYQHVLEVLDLHATKAKVKQ